MYNRHVLIFLAIVTNTLSFLIFRFNSEIKKMSSMVYLSFQVLIDIFALLTWNLNTFLNPHFGFEIEDLNLLTCRFFTFIQYFSIQCSSYLICLVSIDRYFSITSNLRYISARVAFGTPKLAVKWSLLVCVSCTIINSHFLFINGFYNSPNFVNQTILELINGTEVNKTVKIPYTDPGINCYYYFNRNVHITDIWDYVEFAIYYFTPGSITVVFNILLIYKTTRYNKFTQMNAFLLKSLKRKRKMTYSLLAISFTYIFMTFPSIIYFCFISDSIKKQSLSIADNIGAILDFLHFTNNCTVFFNCFITNLKFRKTVLGFIFRRKYKPEDIGKMTNIEGCRAIIK